MIYRFHPKTFNLGGTERYYTEMAAKGWELVKHGVWLSKFRKTEPKKMRYRVEVIAPELLEDGKPPEEQRSIYEDCGWEYVTGCNQIQVFRSGADSVAPEFYLEPEQQAATLKSLRRSYLNSLTGPLIALVILLLHSMVWWGIGDGEWTAGLFLMWMSQPYILIGVILAEFSLLFGAVWGLCYLHRLYRKMKQGTPLDHNASPHNFIPTVLQVMLVVGFVLALVYAWRDENPAPLPEHTDEPYILLSDLGMEGTRYANPLLEKRSNTVSHTHSFQSDYWKSWEDVESEDGTQSTLHQKVIRLKHPAQMNRTVNALMHHALVQSPEKFAAVEAEGLDQAWVADDWQIIAVRGDLVGLFSWRFHSQEEVQDFLSSVAEKWN